VGGERHAQAALPLGKRVGTHCTGGWLVPRAGLDECGKFHPLGDSILGLNQPVACRYIYYAIWAHYVYTQGVTGGTDQTSGGCSLC
jgi:hypothetical protein